MVKGVIAGLLTLGLAFGAGTATAGAQTPCGGLLQPACPPPVTTPQPPEPAPVPVPEPQPVPPPTPITAAQYTAAEAVLKTSAARDKTGAGAKQARAFAAACRALDRQDDLLAALRRTCLADVAGSAAGDRLDRCRTSTQCVSAGRSLARALKDYAGALRQLNARVDAATEDKACRRALRTSSHDLRVYDQLAAVFPDLVRATATKTPRDDAAVARRVARIDGDNLRTGTQQLKAFRADCR